MHIARQFTRGGIVLLVGNIVQTGATAVAAILVVRLLGPSGSGVYALVVVPASIFQLFLGLGVTVAVTRNVAYYVSAGDNARAVRFAKNAITFTLLTGIALAAVAFAGAGPIATLLLHRSSLAPYIELVSVIEVGQALLQATIAAMIGWSAMGLASLSNVSQALARMIASPLLVVVGFGVGGALAGYAASYLLGGALALLLLFVSRLRTPSDSLKSFAEDVREMVRFGFPPYVAGIVSGLSMYYVPLVLAAFADNATIGYFAAANNVTVPISLISSATAAALFPAFAGLEGVKADLAGAFRKATKYVGYITIPVVFFLAVAARQFMGLLYGEQFVAGTGFLVLLSLASAPVVLGLGIIPSFFNGIGRTRITLYTVGSASACLFVLAPLLSIVAGLGVNGAIYAIFLSNAVLIAVGIGYFRSLFSSSISLRPAVAMVFSGLAGYAIAYLLPSPQSDLLTLFEKLVAFAFVYFTVGPATGAVDLRDLDLIQGLVGDMRFVSGLSAPFFRYQRLVARLAGRQSSST